MKCRIKDCKEKLYCAGYCKGHYKQEIARGINQRREREVEDDEK